jgi:hypothetical protein
MPLRILQGGVRPRRPDPNSTCNQDPLLLRLRLDAGLAPLRLRMRILPLLFLERDRPSDLVGTPPFSSGHSFAFLTKTSFGLMRAEVSVCLIRRFSPLISSFVCPGAPCLARAANSSPNPASKTEHSRLSSRRPRSPTSRRLSRRLSSRCRSSSSLPSAPLAASSNSRLVGCSGVLGLLRLGLQLLPRAPSGCLLSGLPLLASSDEREGERTV